MKTEVLQKKISRYLQGNAMPAETRQIQTWLSCTDNGKVQLTEAEMENVENEILGEVQAYTAYPLFFPRQESWWKKITAFS